MKSLVVVGNFGYYKNALNGQTMRTRSIFQLLNEQYLQPEVLINKIDTSELKTNFFEKLKFLMGAAVLIIQTNVIIILPAQRALNLFFPLCYSFKLLTKKKVHYVVIGGWLSDVLKSKPKFIKMLRRFDSIHVQTKGLVNELNSLELDNIYYLSNFRYYMKNDAINPQDQKFNNKIVYYSRIVKQKGVEELIHIINRINSGLFKDQIKLDLFGPISDEYQLEFLSLIRENTNINYLGVLHPDKVLSALSRYQFFVLPTHYKTEGFPGAILDAMSAGLPIISAKWNYSNEFVIEGYNGFTYNPGDDKKLIDVILELISDNDILKNMSINSYQLSKNFHPDIVGENFINLVIDKA